MGGGWTFRRDGWRATALDKYAHVALISYICSAPPPPPDLARAPRVRCAVCVRAGSRAAAGPTIRPPAPPAPPLPPPVALNAPRASLNPPLASPPGAPGLGPILDRQPRQRRPQRQLNVNAHRAVYYLRLMLPRPPRPCKAPNFGSAPQRSSRTSPPPLQPVLEPGRVCRSDPPPPRPTQTRPSALPPTPRLLCDPYSPPLPPSAPRCPPLPPLPPPSPPSKRSKMTPSQAHLSVYPHPPLTPFAHPKPPAPPAQPFQPLPPTSRPPPPPLSPPRPPPFPPLLTPPKSGL